MIMRVSEREYRQNAARVKQNPEWGQGFYFKAGDGRYYKTLNRGFEAMRERQEFEEKIKIENGKGQLQLTDEFLALL